MRILGISAFYHDSAACVIEDGRILAAVQEERFTRKKHDSSFPINAIQYCLKACKTDLTEVEYIAFYDKPFLKFERLLETYLAFSPRGFQSFSIAMPLWLKEKLFQKILLRKELIKLGANVDIESRLLFAEHHQSHAASAFFASPFEEAIVLTMDGVGEWVTTSVAIGRGNHLEIMKEIHFPHSLGLLYSAFTHYLGFKVNSGEYKVMGLAPYGEAKYIDLIQNTLIDLKADGTFWLDMQYFDYCTGLQMTNKKFDELFRGERRKPEEPLTQKHMDIAASIQWITTEIVLRLTRSLAQEFGISNLCLAGGVALNCVTNGSVLRDGKFDGIWVQPAAGDGGGSVGAALAAYYTHLNNPRATNGRDGMFGSYLGPEFSEAEIELQLTTAGAKFEKLSDSAMISTTVDALIDGKAVGWFQGRMEFGPRALGARSILGDPRSVTMQKTLNLRVKYRESFRPFAPAVLEEDAADWFELDCVSPYMLFAANVVKNKQKPITEEEQLLFGIDKLNVPRSEIPAVTHVDYSARVQTVDRQTNPRFHELLSAFKFRTGCPVLVNTSFNVRGEPIVCSPQDAFRCFMGSEIELLVIGNYVLYKENQEAFLKMTFNAAFEPD